MTACLGRDHPVLPGRPSALKSWEGGHGPGDERSRERSRRLRTDGGARDGDTGRETRGGEKSCI